MSCVRLLQRNGVKRVIAVSDIHGWYRPLVELFERVGIIERVDEDGGNTFKIGGDRLQYKGSETLIIIPGDFVDADAEGRKVLDLISNLERETLRTGGELIALLGNHERNLLQEDLRYWDQIEEYYEWLESRPLVAIVNNVLFIHGGISKKAYHMIEESCRDDEDFVTCFTRSLEEDANICWQVTNRTFALQDEETLSKIMESIRIEYMVIGHAPIYGKNREEIKLVGPQIGGRMRVFNIDADMGDWHIEGEIIKKGGALSMCWMDDGLEIEYIYRNSQL
ncbi:MAG: metallophosphoesterase [Spirochaetota bacterium]|nr:metallophosphoesterase [Spirochaetota bacterium]